MEITAQVRPLLLDTRVEIVLHTREYRKRNSSGLCALRLLKNATLHLYGKRDAPLDLARLQEEGRRVLILHPSEQAKLLTPDVVRRDPRPITLVVPDGTWRQARRATLRIPGLQEAEVVRLPQAIEDTMQALIEAIGILEGQEVADALDSRRTALDELPGNCKSAIAHVVASRSREEHSPDSAPLRLDVLYQDEFLVAVNKPSGMLVHRGWAKDRTPALQILRDQLGRRVHPVHRLDRATSGVLLFALSSEVARDLSTALTSAEAEKRYLAICRGNRLKTQRLDHPLTAEKGGGKLAATTEFRLLGTFERYGLVEARPKTGRTHQIRKHLKHLDHPIIGDVRYGKGEHNRLFRRRFGLHRLALHCASVRLRHPRDGEMLQLSAPLPADLEAVVAQFQPVAPG